MEHTIYFGAGCFWCVEAVFRNIRGVDSVESGYANGYHSKIPNYRQISTNSTGYAEVVRIQYNDSVISTEQLLEIIFGTHDTTTLNQQGTDIGTQYRSAVFYTTLEQSKIANKIIDYLAKIGIHATTVVQPITHYGKADEDHQNYYEKNRNEAYCATVIEPKLKKFKERFSQYAK